MRKINGETFRIFIFSIGRGQGAFTYKLVSLVSAELSNPHNSVIKCLATVFGLSERPLLNVSQTGSISLGAVKRSVIQAVAENHACNITCATIEIY